MSFEFEEHEQFHISNNFFCIDLNHPIEWNDYVPFLKRKTCTKPYSVERTEKGNYRFFEVVPSNRDGRVKNVIVARWKYTSVSTYILNKNENCILSLGTDVDSGLWTYCGCGYQWNSKPSGTTENRWPNFWWIFLGIKVHFYGFIDDRRDSLNVERRMFNAIQWRQPFWKTLVKCSDWKVFISIHDSLFIQTKELQGFFWFKRIYTIFLHMACILYSCIFLSCHMKQWNNEQLCVQSTSWRKIVVLMSMR